MAWRLRALSRRGGQHQSNETLVEIGISPAEVFDCEEQLVELDVVPVATGYAGVVEDDCVSLVVADDDEVVRDRPARLLVMCSVAWVVGIAQAVREHADYHRPSESQLVLDALAG